nr:ATP/GTP-binding protein [Deinobacterium chartae]
MKLLICGPVGAGKTTFVSTLSEIPVVETDELASEAIGKEYTTVALDFGRLTLDEQVLHLFGTPGQDRYHFMWDVLAEGALGLVMLVAGDRPADFGNARRILEYVTSRHPIPFVLGVTRQDLEAVWRPAEIALFFGVPAHQVVGLDATSPTAAVRVLAQLLTFIRDSEELVP